MKEENIKNNASRCFAPYNLCVSTFINALLDIRPSTWSEWNATLDNSRYGSNLFIGHIYFIVVAGRPARRGAL